MTADRTGSLAFHGNTDVCGIFRGMYETVSSPAHGGAVQQTGEEQTPCISIYAAIACSITCESQHLKSQTAQKPEVSFNKTQYEL
jgi:hypothetical protein